MDNAATNPTSVRDPDPASPTSSTVYVVQDVLRKNLASGEMERIHDLRPAENFGRVQFLFDHKTQASIYNTVPIIRALRAMLASFSDDDYLLLLGDPALLAAAAAIAAYRNHGRFKILKYDRIVARHEPSFEARGARFRYLPIPIDISGRVIT